jgi:hypothetical protein
MALTANSFEADASSFDPKEILGQFKIHEQPVSRPPSQEDVTGVQYGIIISDGPLHIRLLGDTPIGAWIPMGASRLEITPQLNMFPSSANTVYLKEVYSQVALGTPRPRGPHRSAAPTPEQSNAELPSLDVLGKRTVIWTEGASASAWLGESGKTSLKTGREGRVIGIVVDPVFSARVTVIPTSTEVLSRFSDIEVGLLPQPEDWLGVAGSGSISVKLEREPSELRQFDAVEDRIKKKDVLADLAIGYPFTGWLARDGSAIFAYQPKSMDFRYPAFPPSRGFNVFGQMAYLRFDRAIGQLALGSRAANIEAPSTLEFRDLEGFRATNGIIPASVGSVHGSDARLLFNGISEAWLNGEPLVHLSDSMLWSIGFIGILAGVIQMIAAGIAIAKELVGRRGGASPLSAK